MNEMKAMAVAGEAKKKAPKRLWVT